MKILHVMPGLSRESGGPSRSVQGLVAGLNAAGVKTWLMTLNKGDEPWINGVTHFINGESFEAVVERIRPDIVHLHCIWSPALHRCAAICRRRRIPYVIAPRGMLEPWSLEQKWLKKKIARLLYQDHDLKCAAALHATAASEAEQFRRLGFKNLVIVSPNGVNVPKEWGTGNGGRGTDEGIRRVLFVSRMHPKKGVIELVEAWGRLVDSRRNRRLSVARDSSEPSRAQASAESLVVSGWECELVYTVSGETEREYEAKVKAKVKELGLEDQFIFTGALNDEKKWQAYARADIFVLPTYSENFGIVVAEALWAGVPVITTKGTPWQELNERGCGWWVDVSVESLTVALKEAMSLDDVQRREMGARGRALVEEKYTWNAVVKAMVKGYEAILKGKTTWK